VLGSNLWIESLRSRYIRYFPLERADFESWAARASRFWSSSTWGSKHLRQRA
jgi:hypothetical protein